MRVFRGCGFCRSNGTLPLAAPFCSVCGARLVDAALASCVPRPGGCARSAASTLGWATATCHWHPTRPMSRATPRRRRALTTPPDGVGMVGSQSILALGGAATSAVRGPSAEAKKSARRRRRAATTPPDGVGERSPVLATAGCRLVTAGCRLVVSVTGPEAKWHCCGARETAQALQHGCGDDCLRSASLSLRCRRDRAALRAEPMPAPPA